MFNGGTRKRMLAAAIGSNNPSLGMESSHHSSPRSKLLDQSPISHKTGHSSRPGMPHNAAAAAAAAVAGRATLAAARAACAAACVVQASASSSGKEISIDEGYGGNNEFADNEPNSKVNDFFLHIFLNLFYSQNVQII